ncbi:RNA-guided endonuclease TnpB family protein [Caldisphaera sp.]|uniref:RNA-guided endonuclease TnpB family protein n=1 Tax=Caldisphaera sp. TaxID=2060322 RepID=UPI00397CADFE
MPMGSEGLLTLTVNVKVSPEPDLYKKLVDLMKQYREALNYSIKFIIENKAISLGKAHRLLYKVLKEKYGLPSKIAQDCYREAIAIAKSWLKNTNKGKIPRANNLRIWLTHGQSYRIKGDYVELLGGYRLKIIGLDRRYDSYPNREARLLLKDGKFILKIYKRVPEPAKYSPSGVLAVDVNERQIVVGNRKSEYRFETHIERALHYRQLAENLQKRHSYPKYNASLRRRGIKRRIKSFHRKAKNIIDDWAKKVSHTIVLLAKQRQHAVVREDLTNLVEALRKLPKEHKTALLILGYRRLEYWIDWQCEKQGVPSIVINPKGTSSICPICGSKLVEVNYRKLKCPKCGFEANRDTIAVINIEKKAYKKMGGSLTTPTAPQMTDVIPNR